MRGPDRAPARGVRPVVQPVIPAVPVRCRLDLPDAERRAADLAQVRAHARLDRRGAEQQVLRCLRPHADVLAARARRSRGAGGRRRSLGVVAVCGHKNPRSGRSCGRNYPGSIPPPLRMDASAGVYARTGDHSACHAAANVRPNARMAAFRRLWDWMYPRTAAGSGLCGANAVTAADPVDYVVALCPRISGPAGCLPGL